MAVILSDSLSFVNSNLLIQTNLVKCYIFFMDNKAIRRQNLINLINQFGTIKALAEFAEMSDSHISQIKGGTSKIGDKLARKIEQKFSKPVGWIDTRHGTGTSEDPAVYLVGDNPDPYQTSLDQSAIILATNFIFDRYGADGMKERGAKWCAKTIIFLYDLFQDPASQQLNNSTINKMIASHENDD